jgi:cytochrome c oxidase assembly protein subunit 15
MITAHMVTAFVIVVLLIGVITRSQQARLKALRFDLPAKWHLWLKIALALTLLQVTMGTQIREAVDGFSHTLDSDSRSLWREHFPIIFYIHRSFSSLILFTNLWLSYRLIRSETTGAFYKRFGWALASLVVIAILSGVSLDRLGFPAVAQPLHLLLANLIFGCQFFLWSSSRYALRSS